MLAVEPGLLLNHVTPEGSLVEINYGLSLKDVFCESHCELVATGLQEVLVVAVWIVLGFDGLAANIVPGVEELKFVPFDLNTVLVLNLLTPLDDTEVGPVVKTF